MVAGRHQVGIDILINDRDVNRFIANMRREVSAIAPHPARAGARQTAAVQTRLAESEATIRRSVRAGQLDPLAARTARRQITATAGEYGIDPAAVRNEATQINRALRQRAAAERRRAAASERAAQQQAAQEAAEAAARQQAAAAQRQAQQAARQTARQQQQQANQAARQQAQQQQAAARAQTQAQQQQQRAQQQAARAAQQAANQQARQAQQQANRAARQAQQQQAQQQRQQQRAQAAQQAAAQQAAAVAQANAVATRTQRFQAALYQRQTGQQRLATSFPQFGQLLGARALSVASYAAPGALIFGLLKNVREVTQEVLKLERVTARLRNQFVALGKGNEFAGFRRQLLEVARDTGVAADQVAFVGLQMAGAFGNTELAARRTREAIRAAQVSGLDLTEIVDSLTAASISYGTSIDAITDKAVGLEQRFGVANSQSIKALGDLSAVAHDAGLSLDEVGAMLGIIQQRSGRTGAAITEGLSRILPAIGERGADLLKIATQTPALATAAGDIARNLRAGATGQVLITLANHWKDLNKTTRDYILSLLGSRRETQYLIPLFQDVDKLQDEIAKSGQDAGKAMQAQAEQHRTLGYQLARVREQFNQLGDALAQLGVLSGFATLAAGAAGLIQVLGSGVRLFQEFNNFTQGVPGRIISMAIAIRTLTAALRLMATLQQSGLIRQGLSILAGRAAAGTAAQAGATAAATTVAGSVPFLIPFVGLQHAAPPPFLVPGVGLQSTAPGAAQVAAAGGGRFGPAGAAFLGGKAFLGRVGALVGGGAGVGALVVGAAIATKVAFDTLDDAARKRAERYRQQLSTLDLEHLLQAKEPSRLSGKPGPTEVLKSGFGLLRPYKGKKYQAYLDEVQTSLTDLLDTLTDEDTRYIVEMIKGYHDVEGKWTAAYAAEMAKRMGNLGYGPQANGDNVFAPPEAQVDFPDAADVADKVSKPLQDDLAKILKGDRGEELLKRFSKELALLPKDQRDAIFRLYAKRKNGIDDITDDAQAEIADFERLFARGKVSYSGLLQVLAAQLVQLRRADTNIPGSAEHQAVLDAEDRMRELTTERLQKDIDLALSFSTLTGHDPIQSQIDILESVLPKNPQLQEDPEKFADMVAQLLSLYQQKADRIFEETGNVVNIAIPTWLKEMIATVKARVVATAASVAAQAAAEEQALKDMPNWLASVNIWIAGAIGATKAAADEAAGKAGTDPLANLDIPDYVSPSFDTTHKKNKVTADQIAKARFDLLKAQAEGNALLLAQIEVDEAKDAEVRARNGTIVDQLNAQAARIRADRGLRKAVYDAADAARSVAIAVAESIGDAATVGRLTVQQAQDELNRVIAEGGGQTEIDKARANLISAQATERDRAREARMADLDYLFEFDRITAQQYIQGLEAELRQIPETNVELRREIERKIRQIREDMGKDLQFNLPENIVPTFYEGRRLTQAGYGAIPALAGAQTPTAQSYSDNRTVNIVLNATNAVDGDAAVEKIIGVLNEPSRYGTRPRVVIGG